VTTTTRRRVRRLTDRDIRLEGVSPVQDAHLKEDLSMKRLIFAVLAAALALLPAVAVAKDGRGDRDRDGLRNKAEHRHGTDPRDVDTDDDGIEDGDEVDYGFRPLKRDPKGNAGSVKSFDAATGTLVLSPLKGGELSALVTDDTHLQCKKAKEARTSRNGDEEEGKEHGRHGQKPGHAKGHHRHEPGDDHGDDEEEPSDDHGDDEEEPSDDQDEPGDDDDGDDGEEPGDEHGHHGHHGHHSVKCTTDALVEGTLVRRARLDVVDGEAVWTKLKIVG